MSRYTTTQNPVQPFVSRRDALRLAGATAVAAMLSTHLPGLARITRASASGIPVEPGAGLWSTWLLIPGDRFRPGAPPDEMTTATEIAAIKRKMSRLDEAGQDRIAYWDAGSPGSRWNEIALRHVIDAGLGPDQAYRVMALVNGAIHDATAAAWDAKHAWNRPRPEHTDASIQPLLPTPANPSYPSLHAATAAASAVILGHLFPADAATFDRLAREAAGSRVAAGVAFPSDVSTGLPVGRQVGELFVAHALTDGLDAS